MGVEVQVLSRAPITDIVIEHGGYGVTVNTEVCGASDSGSIPDNRPKYSYGILQAWRKFITTSSICIIRKVGFSKIFER